MKRSALVAVALAIAATLVMSACGGSHSPASSPGSGTSSAPASGAAAPASAAAAPAGGGAKFLACMVTDKGEINDRSFSASSWAGMEAAVAADRNVTVEYLESKVPGDYVKNIDTFLGEKCGIIVTIGHPMGAATEAAAAANPSQDFAIVDCSYASQCLTGTREGNIDQLVFSTQDGSGETKGVAAAVKTAVLSAVDGTFKGGTIPTPAKSPV